MPTRRSATASSGKPPGADDCWILHERARRYDWRGAGQLSIKTFFGGKALYQVKRGYHAVDDSSYLVLNEGQSYGINIDAKEPVESFCIFFAPGFTENVRRSLAVRPEVLLDEPDGERLAPLCFFERTYAHDRVLSPALLRLRKQYQGQVGESGWFLEQFHGIVECLLRAHEKTVREAQKLHTVRAATREELYRRVWRARDYAAAMFASRVTLAELAAVACLSPNHLLRTFRQAFGQTPHQYLTNCRLQRAKLLLAKTEMPVTEICLEVGFESLGSFSIRFRREFGLTPTEFRNQMERAS